MASLSLSSTLHTPSSSFYPISNTRFLSLPSIISVTTNLKLLLTKPIPLLHNRRNHGPSFTAQALDFSGSFFEGGFGAEDDDDPPSPPGSGPGIAVAEEKPEPQCPPGLRQYETMAVLRPDMTEDERLALTQKYEELLVAGGGMYVEVFNRGVIPLAYSIRKKNKAGETNTYLDGIYLLFTYFTKAESMEVLEATLKADDDVIRSSSFKIRKRKY
ncbi:40S ribosomal protein S6 [Ancistrocladus abbreviatus]